MLACAWASPTRHAAEIVAPAGSGLVPADGNRAPVTPEGLAALFPAVEEFQVVKTIVIQDSRGYGGYLG